MVDLSIIIPMYNVEQYLPRCVNSVKCLNIKPYSWEMILINDGSPDNSFQVAHKLTKDLKNITIISQKNKGLGGARNTGINNASGKYVLFLDADDLLDVNNVKQCIQAAFKDHLDILEFGAAMIKENKEVLKNIQAKSEQVSNGIDYQETIDYSGSACNKLYALDFLLIFNLQFMEKIYGEDFEFNTRAFFYAKRVKAIDIIAAYFVQSPNSITRNKHKETKAKYVEDYIKIIKSLHNFKGELNRLSYKQLNYLESQISKVTVNSFWFLIKNRFGISAILNHKKYLKKYNILFLDKPFKENYGKEFIRILFLKI